MPKVAKRRGVRGQSEEQAPTPLCWVTDGQRVIDAAGRSSQWSPPVLPRTVLRRKRCRRGKTCVLPLCHRTPRRFAPATPKAALAGGMRLPDWTSHSNVTPYFPASKISSSTRPSMGGICRSSRRAMVGATSRLAMRGSTTPFLIPRPEAMKMPSSSGSELM